MSEETTLYKVLALAFLRPKEDLLKVLREVPAFRDALRDVSLETLQREYDLLFSLSVAGGLPPYETEYGLKDIFMKTQRMADISGFYRAFGMEVSTATHQRIDFIGTELELMHWLTLKESHAEAIGLQEATHLCHDAAAKFLEEHLGRWARFFGKQMIQKTQSPYYRTLGQQLCDLIDEDCRRFKIEPKQISQFEPSEPEAEFSCAGSESPNDDTEYLPVV